MPNQIKAVTVPFPIKGVDRARAYADQPPGTTPDCKNVRAFSIDAERARGGSRPGTKKAYAQQVGASATPVQWLGWLDTGFGDTVFYGDDFPYADGTLNGATGTKWASATGLSVSANRAKPTSETTVPFTGSSGTHGDIGADTWDDFELTTHFSWTIGSTSSLVITQTRTVGAVTYTATITVAYASTRVAFPGLGYYSTLTVSCSITDGTTTKKAQTAVSFGMANWVPEVFVTVKADKDTVTVTETHAGGSRTATCARVEGSYGSLSFVLTATRATGASETEQPDTHIRCWLHDIYLTASTRTIALTRELVAMGGRDLWAESAEGTLAAVTAADTFANIALYSAAPCNGRLYIADGVQPREYSPVGAGAVTTFAARKGEIVKTCSGVANWRNRLIWFDDSMAPQNYYMSRVDEPYDYDYGYDDASSAIAGNFFATGRLNDRIVAVIPAGDNTLIFGLSRSIWVMRGDPGAGGQVFQVSHETGILSNNAWCADDAGAIYFLGEEGFYRMVPGGVPQNLSKSRIPEIGGYKPVAGAGASGQYYVTLAYDAARQGVLIFLTPFTSGAATHYFYDIRTDGFFPESYPNALGPSCACYYNARTPAYRKLLLGARNGYLYEQDDATKSDIVDAQTTTAISSYVWLGPLRLAGQMNDAIVTDMVGNLPSTSDPVAVGIYGASTLERTLVVTAAAAATWIANRNMSIRTRVRGGAHAVKLSNATAAKAWSFEQLMARYRIGGRQR